MSNRRQAIGSEGEELAGRFLRRRGYRILERNYRCCFGEIDLVASDGKTICFVEVRARSSSEYGTPEQSITKTKRRYLSRTAMNYAREKRLADVDLRFDVVSVDFSSQPPELRLHQDAFPLSSRAGAR